MALQDDLRAQLIKQFAAEVVELTENDGQKYQGRGVFCLVWREYLPKVEALHAACGCLSDAAGVLLLSALSVSHGSTGQRTGRGEKREEADGQSGKVGNWLSSGLW